MKPPTEKSISHLEAHLAALLHAGTWIACALIGLGLPLMLLLHRGHHPPNPLAGIGDRLMKAGIAVFILLPVLRVGAMFLLFARQRDYRFATIAMLVLLIILVGVLVGVFLTGAPG
jgi:hypothetical protein